MLFLPKLTSLGLTGLSASGLGAYFIPRYFQEKGSASDLIYETQEVKELDSEQFSRFLEAEEIILKELRENYAKLGKAIARIREEKGKVHGEVDNQLQKVAKEEEELSKNYRETQEMLSKLEQLTRQRTKVVSSRLNVESVLGALKYYNDAMQKSGAVMTQWGENINKIVCAIKDTKGSKSCSEERWLVNSSKSSVVPVAISESSSEGGGTESSKNAKVQLRKSQEKLEAQLKSLESFIKQAAAQHLLRQSQEVVFESIKNKLVEETKWLESFSDQWNKGISDKVAESASKTENLNKSYKELNDKYKKWETLKQGELALHNWSGKLHNSICNNPLNVKKSDCHNSI